MCGRIPKYKTTRTTILNQKRFKNTRILKAHGHHWRYGSKHYALWIKHTTLAFGRTHRMIFLYSCCLIHIFAASGTPSILAKHILLFFFFFFPQSGRCYLIPLHHLPTVALFVIFSPPGSSVQSVCFASLTFPNRKKCCLCIRIHCCYLFPFLALYPVILAWRYEKGYKNMPLA